MAKEKSKRKVFVGLSGGVDSSVSAVLLKKAGYDVTGVFIKVWQPDFLSCNSKEDRLDAMRVAAHLNIPFRTLNLEKEYKKEVVDYMLREYKKGKTPNPDVMCNKEVKFGAFLKYARKEGADYVATGHYAQNIFNKKSGLYELHKGTDDNKDQSYFLWTLTQKELKNIIFPVGGYKKEQVRVLAKKFGLPTALKKDSQGLCFIGKVDMKDFLSHYIKEKNGNVVNEKGEIIGHHQGVTFYTINERHGFVITKKTPNDRPYYVVGKKFKENILIVSKNKQEISNKKNEIVLENYNFISTHPKIGELLNGRIRYREKLFSCLISRINEKNIKTKIKNNHYNIAIGQSMVLYRGGICIGGGVIT